MGFQLFTAKGGKYTPQITLNKGGGFSLSSGMHHRFGLDKYEGVKLYFDPDTKRIGVQPVEQLGEGVFRLKKRENEKGAFFSARSFLQAYNLSPEKYQGRYAPEEVEDSEFGHMFVIKLDS